MSNSCGFLPRPERLCLTSFAQEHLAGQAQVRCKERKTMLRATGCADQDLMQNWERWAGAQVNSREAGTAGPRTRLDNRSRWVVHYRKGRRRRRRRALPAPCYLAKNGRVYCGVHTWSCTGRRMPSGAQGHSVRVAVQNFSFSTQFFNSVFKLGI
jgi:hypothetical protein